MTYQLHLGDCLEFMKSMPDKSVDLIVTDPPYGLSFEYNSFEDTKENLKTLIDKAFPEIFRLGKLVAITPGIGNLHFYPPPDWMFSWFYSGGPNYSSFGFNCWQPILVYGKDPYLRDGLGARSDVIQDNIPAKKNGHPCPKPLSFMKKLIIRTSTRNNDTIFDPFMGSGTTGVAAIQLGRNFIGCEIDPTYYAIAEKRIHEATLQPQLFTSKPIEETQEELL
jgi:site-specific DNA-methyltransferase (adenine-specific)